MSHTSPYCVSRSGSTLTSVTYAMIRGLGALAFGLLAILGISSTGQATSDVDEMFDTLAQANRFVSVEPAGSRGAIGTTLGVGIVQTPIDQNPEIMDAQLNGDFGRRDGAGTVESQRIWVTKGILTPIDIGLTAGTLGRGNARQLGGSVQVTLVEGFRMPALAIRAAHLRIDGMDETAFTTTGAEILAAWGILGWVTPWIGLGANQHDGRIETGLSGDGGYLLTQNETTKDFTRKWTTAENTVGVIVALGSPFAQLALESRGNSLSGGSSEQRSVAVRLSLGI